MSTLKRKGLLTEPTPNDEEEALEVVEGQAKDDEDAAEMIRNTARTALTEVAFQCEQWVMFVYDGKMFPGIVKKVDCGRIQVKCLEYEDKKEAQNYFRWPTPDDINYYAYENVISLMCVLQEQEEGSVRRIRCRVGRSH